MARVMDGEQKMSNWPKAAKEYVELHPDKHIAVGQSKRSEHKLMAIRLIGKRIFISYNKDLKYFVAWNVLPNMGDARGADDVWFKTDAQSKKVYAEKQRLIAFHKPVYEKGKLICFQKICFFPASEFIQFYDNYETYMEPNRGDSYFQAPTAEFQ